MGSEMADPGVVRRRCSVQNHDWGVSGDQSTVARLFEKNWEGGIEPERPYAELWMGTRDSGPSSVVEEEQSVGPTAAEVTLKSWVKENPRVLGDKVVAKWATDLPFSFKVLSVAKALSIQTHPDKELAKTLNEMHPNLYKDPNHKPEMAIAITEFKALCGFLSTKELKDALSNVPEIKEMAGLEDASKFLDVKDQDGCEDVKAVLQSIFTKLMSAGKESF